MRDAGKITAEELRSCFPEFQMGVAVRRAGIFDRSDRNRGGIFRGS